MKLMSESQKIDIGLTSSNLNGAGTGPYYPMGKYGKALFVVECGAMAAATTAIIQVMQAQDAAGAGVKAITNNTATMTANTDVAAATLTVNAVQAGDVVTVNGLTFTAAAAADLAKRVFLAGANGATADSLAAAINHPVAGVPGITAASNGVAVVTLTAAEPGENNITITGASGTITPATLRAVGYVECDAAFLDTVNGFSHVALRVTTNAATQTGAVLLRGQGRFSPIQTVAAAKANIQP